MGRLKEATAIIKAMFGHKVVDFAGQHFDLTQQIAYPLARQQPCEPFLLGGGGPKLLSWAASEADVVSVVPQSAPGGKFASSMLTSKSMLERVGQLREISGSRFTTINTIIWHVE
jgi:alkanesulfonate monooxygenase SsuD/methylene tetrahydromethanopterin reductase-like flavin-dependent oxidoreductase (luciferase family)